MQVTETLSDGLKRAFTVVVPAADIEGKCSAKLADISRTIKLPASAPGKVPVNLVRQRYGSSVLAEVMQDSLDKATDQVIEDRGPASRRPAESGAHRRAAGHRLGPRAGSVVQRRAGNPS